ncbi:MAG: SHOCT domain-containing protein [Ktedonobacteraceae bacterium]
MPLVSAITESERTPMMNWGYGYGWPMMGGMLFWGLFCILLLALSVWALLHWMKRSSPQSTPHPAVSDQLSAMEILRQRYARGEIDTPTFEQMREQFQDQQSTASRF